jgi:hypothetical protein
MRFSEGSIALPKEQSGAMLDKFVTGYCTNPDAGLF